MMAWGREPAIGSLDFEGCAEFSFARLHFIGNLEGCAAVSADGAGQVLPSEGASVGGVAYALPPALRADGAGSPQIGPV